MCIYCGTQKYRQIYKNHFGQIPSDGTGRTYDIHHIDGNRNNNEITNLKALSIQDHYDIHFAQGDYGACFKLSGKMKLSQNELSLMASLNARKRVANGTNPFVGGEMQRKTQRKLVAEGNHHLLGPEHNLKRIKNGTHQFLGGEIQRKITKLRIENNTHNFQGINNPSHRRIINGTHNFQDKQKSKERATNLINSGRHGCLNENHPNKIKVICPHCDKIGTAMPMARWHFDNCKLKNNE